MSRRMELEREVAMLRAELDWRDIERAAWTTERAEWRLEREEWRARLERAEERAQDAERALWLALGLPAVPVRCDLTSSDYPDTVKA